VILNSDTTIDVINMLIGQLMPQNDHSGQACVEPGVPMEVGHSTAGPLAVDEPMAIDQPPQTSHSQGRIAATERPSRNRRLPARYRDEVPQSAPPVIISPPEPEPEPEPTSQLPRVFLIVRDGLKTILGAFGLWRSYPHCPSYDPDSVVCDEDLAKPLSNHTSGIPRPTHPGPP
jgi:hypothetical protein